MQAFHPPALLLLATLALPAQQSAPTTRNADPGIATITEERVLEVLQFLAADELLGRDSPSPGLTRAGEFLARRYKAAKLEGGAQGGAFFHVYQLPGTRIDSTKLTVRVGCDDGTESDLLPDADVRVFRSGGAFASSLGDVEVVAIEDFGQRGSGRGQRTRKPQLVLVSETDALWLACAGARESLSRGGRGEAPVVLVRKAALAGKTVAKAAINLTEPEKVDISLRNVVAVLPGAERRSEIVLVSSHYDHIGISGAVRGDAINNGADDDATGTTAVLLLAEALAARGSRLPRTVAFVNFSAEEKGLRGSAAFAEKPPFPLERVVCNLNLEMLGRPAPGKQGLAWLTGRKLSDLESMLAPALASAGVECIPFELEAQLFFQSDNYSLAKKGVVAHSISAGYLHPDYHRPSDEVAKIDIPHMTKVIRGIYAACVDIASRDQRPTYNEDGKTLLKR